MIIKLEERPQFQRARFNWTETINQWWVRLEFNKQDRSFNWGKMVKKQPKLQKRANYDKWIWRTWTFIYLFKLRFQQIRAWQTRIKSRRSSVKLGFRRFTRFRVFCSNMKNTRFQTTWSRISFFSKVKVWGHNSNDMVSCTVIHKFSKFCRTIGLRSPWANFAHHAVPLSMTNNVKKLCVRRNIC